MSKLDQLRTAVRNETLPLPERRAAAEHYVTELVNAVPEPGADDPEVVALQTRPSADGPLGDILPHAWEVQNELRGWARSGPTTLQACKHAHGGRRFQVLLAVAADESAHQLERLEACRLILEDHLPPRNFYRVNRYTPEQLLSKVKPPTALKWGSWREGKVPVCRPPSSMADVWEI